MPTGPRKRVPGHVQSGVRQQAVKGEIRQPDLARLVGFFFESAGGERAVAKLLYDEFKAAGEGSIVRQRILDLILRATRFANERTPRVDDLGALSDEDLDRELNAVMAELADTLGGADAAQEGDRPGGAAGQGQGPGPTQPVEAPGPAGADPAAGPGADDPPGAGA